MESALSRPGRFRKVRDGQEVKEITIGDGEKRVRYVLAQLTEVDAKDTWRNIRREMRRVYLVEFVGTNGLVLKRTETLPA